MKTIFSQDRNGDLWAVEVDNPTKLQLVVRKKDVSPEYYNLLSSSFLLYDFIKNIIEPMKKHGEVLEAAGESSKTSSLVKMGSAFVEFAASAQLIKRSAEEGLDVFKSKEK